MAPLVRGLETDSESKGATGIDAWGQVGEDDGWGDEDGWGDSTDPDGDGDGDDDSRRGVGIGASMRPVALHGGATRLGGSSTVLTGNRGVEKSLSSSSTSPASTPLGASVQGR